MILDAIAVAERALALLCLYAAAGAALFVALFDHHLPRARAAICRCAIVWALAGGVLIALQPLLEASRMAGAPSGATNPLLLHLAWHSSRGTAQTLQLLGLVLVAFGLRAHRQVRGWPIMLALLGALLAAGALVATGHTSVNPRRAILAPLLAVHLWLVAFWLGALWPLRLTLLHEPPATAVAVLQRFSRLAGVLVPCLAGAGLIMAFVLIDRVVVLRRPYGLLLEGKLAVFLLLLVLAALNRWRFTPALTATPSAARPALLRSIGAEYLLIAAVLVMTATLTTLFSPED